METANRRSFLTSIGAAAALGGAVATRVEAGTPMALTKEIVPGSPYPTFSRAAKYGQIVYVSGVLGQIPGSRQLASADFPGQCKQAMENLEASVQAAGSNMDKVLKCGAFLVEQSDFATFNDIYLTYFPSDPPARSTVIVKALVAAGAKIEIDCVASV